MSKLSSAADFGRGHRKRPICRPQVDGCVRDDGDDASQRGLRSAKYQGVRRMLGELPVQSASHL